MFDLAACCAVYFAAINLLTYLAFRSDKARAVAGQWRHPESRLLSLAMFGGWLGAKLAQRRYRHKTRKQPFRTLLNLVPVVWIGLFLSLLIPATGVLDMNWPQFELPAYAKKTDRPTPKFFTRVAN